eukprot:TRINITY_DN33049_c0_g1_i1.p1 TRINITY_DN33049_c0_g1~~TRINITY_DN33049_c0_g1_i1.p1  ORF type:complete len:417 (-),score=47.07 TRINITY_DN33049_c0_g1_i1:57-1136(-)
MTQEAFRMGRSEVRDLLIRYEKAVEEDALNMLHPRPQERALLGPDILQRRADLIRKARDANRKYIEAVIADLPDMCDGPLPPPARPVAEMVAPGDGAGSLPASSYGSMASVFLHLFRDWSADCSHVLTSTYRPAVELLQKFLPDGGNVLLPGAGLGRLALEIAREGYQVEANDASKLFLTFADYVLNRAPAAGASIFPLAHVFSENWSHDQQYLEIKVPSPPPADLLNGGKLGKRAPISLVPGDFAKVYGVGGTRHRRFDAIVTCFFIDTASDIAELFGILDGLLNEGGVWVNIGPLNWRKEARLKLNMEEIIQVWQQMGYEFVARESKDCDYHLATGQKMYTETYKCSLTAAIKRRSS